MWELVSFEVRDESGTEQPFGPDPIGVINYDRSGRLVVALGARGRERTSSDDLDAISPEEAQAAMRSFAAYTGTWRVDEAASTVIHDIALASAPNMVGEQLRPYTLEGDLLTLEPPERESGGRVRAARLVWRRV